jgi:hypothetical protein
MGDDIQLKLMFVNYDSPNPTGELAVRTTNSVSEVKKRILAEQWPEGHTPVENVLRIRVFIGGREMQDSAAMREYKASFIANGATPVHVAYVPKTTGDESAAGPPGEKKDDQARPQCFCTVL